MREISRDRLLELLEEHVQLKKVSKITGIPYPSLMRIFTKKLHKRIKELRDEFNTVRIHKKNKEYVCDKKKLIQLFNEHGSLQKVSEITNIPYSVLYTLFKIKLNINVPRKTKKTKYQYNVNKLIKLFKKYGFLTHVSQITDIPTVNLRNILVKEFGVGLTELRKKLGINRRCLKRRDLDKNAKRYQQVKETYERLGTLEKVGNDLPPKKWTQRRVGVSITTGS